MEVLPGCATSFNDLRIEVGVLKADLENHDKLIDKLTSGIEKIEEMNANLIKMIALHEQRHENHEEDKDDIKTDIKELRNKLSTIPGELIKEMDDKLESLRYDMEGRLETLKKDLTTIIIKDPHLDTNNDPKRKDLEKTLADMKNLRAIIVAAFFILVFLLEHLDWKFLLKLFGG